MLKQGISKRINLNDFKKESEIFKEIIKIESYVRLKER